MSSPWRSAPWTLYRWTSCTPTPAAEARSVLRRALTSMGMPEETISNGVLAASELVANASEHAKGPYELSLRCTDAEIICEVLDHDPTVPDVPAFPDVCPFTPLSEDRGGGLEALCALLAERGRGLHIVHELTAGAWGFRPVEKSAKVAWIAFPAELHQLQHGAQLPPGVDLGFVGLEE
ncbi:ATP-binding protein [Streptantibioticus ferralitis]|uniref:ATP-binding protein n=1 Tax=Streptantibioticus ferralitis TaxID=236510 RepID=A0ABT5ZA89_9ACTN|nr:ATP-binding protein [Streptantibioticus ferralitis]MDF2260583.1 ATP-binding protein [Streptantibioticus ferralitis]